MTILLPTLAVAFAAFCVWLTVRIVNRRETWAKRTSMILVVVLVVYPMSFGPALWLVRHGVLPETVTSLAYCPVAFVGLIAPEPVKGWFGRYLTLWH